MLITPVSWEYISAYGRYEKGILPNGNNSNGESQKYLDAMALIESEFARWQKELSKPKPTKTRNS